MDVSLKESWCVIAPQWGTSNIETGLTFSTGLEFRKTPKWLSSQSSFFSESLIRVYGNVLPPFCLYKEYEREYSGPSPGGNHIPIGDTTESVELEQDIFKAITALWLPRHCPSSLTMLIHCREDDGEWRTVSWSVNPLPRGYGELPFSAPTESTAETVSEIYDGLQRTEKDTTTHIAYRLLFRAMHESESFIRYILLWIVLEGLVGPDSPGETTYRLSQRLGLFIEKHAPRDRFPISRTYLGAQDLNKHAKDGYHLRSTIVHGMKLSEKQIRKMDVRMKEVEDLVRLSFGSVFLDPDLQKTFDSKKRDQYLDSLAFKSTSK